MSLGIDKQQNMRVSLPSDVRLNNVKKQKMGHGVDKESGEDMFGVKQGNRVCCFKC
jgi:hypothetical protein